LSRQKRERENRDLIYDNFEEIVEIASEYGIKLNEENLVWNFDGNNSLSIVHNCKTWLLKVIDGKYALFDQNLAGNPKKGQKFHFQKSFESPYTAIKYIATSHHPAHRVKTRNNAGDYRMQELFEKIKK